MTRRLCLTFILLVLALGSGAAEEPIASIPNPRVKDGTWVTDLPGALRAETKTRLNQSIGEIERTHGIEMAVVVVRSLDGLTVEDAAEKLFKLWGIGKKDRDNGLLFLWSTGDRKVRVEVGYGLEGILPDSKVGAILDQYVIPRFKAGQFDEGVIAGVDTILAAARSEPVALPAVGRTYDIEGWLSWTPWWLRWLAAFPPALLVLKLFRRWRRYRPRKCPRCHTRMNLMSETDDDEALELGQLAEERVGSVDYDVWKCPACEHKFTLRYVKWMSKYDKCPQCSNFTKDSTETVIEPATTHASGLKKVVEKCAFCTFTNEYTKVIPQVSESSSSSGSSSGSSGGSSFGGGSSGGGGASRGY